MKMKKIVNELNEDALKYLYKDMKYNWSNNVDHAVVLTEFIHESDNDKKCISTIYVEKHRSSNHIFLCCKNFFDGPQPTICQIDNMKDFQCQYMTMLNRIKATEVHENTERV